jgi:hypothetical protein
VLVLAWTVDTGPRTSSVSRHAVIGQGHGAWVDATAQTWRAGGRWVHAGAASLFWCNGGRESWTCICRHAFPAGNLLSWWAQCPLHACDDMRRYAATSVLRTASHEIRHVCCRSAALPFQLCKTSFTPVIAGSRRVGGCSLIRRPSWSASHESIYAHAVI